MSTEFNPDALDGFTEHLFLVLGRFRDVAVNNHIDGGNLRDVEAHETAIVSGDTLLNHYDPPVVFTVFSGYEGDADTIRKQTDTFTIDVAVFDWNFSREFGLENVLRLTGNVINNVERNRTLESTPGAGDPVAEDVTWSSLEPDFEFSENEDMVIHWASVSFEVRTRRIKPA
jgi:hypothetical protein